MTTTDMPCALAAVQKASTRWSVEVRRLYVGAIEDAPMALFCQVIGYHDRPGRVIDDDTRDAMDGRLAMPTIGNGEAKSLIQGGADGRGQHHQPVDLAVEERGVYIGIAAALESCQRGSGLALC